MILILVGLSPRAVTVTTRINIFLVGDPYKPSFATVSGSGDSPRYWRTSLGFFNWIYTSQVSGVSHMHISQPEGYNMLPSSSSGIWSSTINTGWTKHPSWGASGREILYSAAPPKATPPRNKGLINKALLRETNG